MEFAKQGGTLHNVQLWVNLPKAHKMSAPRHQHLDNKMGRVTGEDGKSTVRVIAGSYAGTVRPAKAFSPVTLLDILMQSGARVPLTMPAEDNVLILVTGGAVRIDDTPAREGDLVTLGHAGQEISVTAGADARMW